MENSQLKLNAKSVLKSTYWMSFLALLVYDIIYGACNSVTNWIQNIGATSDTGNYTRYLERGDYESALEELSQMQTTQNPIFSLLGYAVSICVAIFFLNILIVGLKKMFLRARITRKADIADMFGMFSSYGSVMKTMFFYDL